LSAIRAVRPTLTLISSAVVEAIVLAEGPIGTAESVARALGLRNRFQLARLLEEEGLPPLHRLAEWMTVLSWVVCAERTQVSLCWMAFRSRRHPSACYRLVKKITGLRWEEVQAKGSTWLMQEFLKEIRAHARRAQQYGSASSPILRQSSGRALRALRYGVSTRFPAIPNDSPN